MALSLTVLSRREHCCCAYDDVKAMPDLKTKFMAWLPSFDKSNSILFMYVHSGRKYWATKSKCFVFPILDSPLTLGVLRRVSREWHA